MNGKTCECEMGRKYYFDKYEYKIKLKCLYKCMKKDGRYLD